MIWNGHFAHFATFPIFSHWSDAEWLGTVNFALSQLFQSLPTEALHKWLEMANFATWTIFSHRITQNCQFHPFCNFSNLFPSKWCRMTQNNQFCLFCNFSNLFPPMWCRMANLAHFATFPIFSHWCGPEWLRMTDFTHFAIFQSFLIKVV